MEYKQSSQPLDDITAYLQNIEYAARGVDERHDRIADRQFRATDSHLNGTMQSFMYQHEVLKRIPFRKAE